MSRDVRRGRPVETGLALLMLAALAAAAFSFRPVTTESGVGPTMIRPDEPSAALVVGRSQSGGLSLLGFELREATRVVSVQVSTGSRCFERVALGDLWPTSFPECPSAVGLAGTVTGGGTFPTGESLVVVDVVVDKDCYDATRRGDRWPPADTCP